MTNTTPASSELLKRILIVAVGLWTVGILCLAIFHTWQGYNAVPVWDMWHSYMDFYEKASAGQVKAWFSRHNEHRLILDHLLMWADLHWFHGNVVLLLTANYVLAALIAAMFWLILDKRLPGEQFRTTRVLLGLFSTAALFLLCQGENLTWGMDGQFWMVFLFPLCAFYLAQKAPAEGITSNFLLVCACGICAVGSMASGLAALPLLAVYAILTRQRISRIVILILLGAYAIVLYGRGGASSGSSYALLLHNLMNHPVDATLYVLALLGLPLSFLFENANVHVPQAFGAVFVLAAAFQTFRILFKPRRDLMQTAMVFYVLFVFASMVAIASGRFTQGAVLAGRYSTVAIVGWLGLLMLYSTDLASLKTGWKALLMLCAVPLMVLTVNAQIKELTNWDEPIFEAKAIILGLALGVRDFAGATQIDGPGEGISFLPHVAEIAYRDHIGMLGVYPFRGARERLGTPAPSPSALAACQGSIESIEVIITDPSFVRVSGRLVSPTTGRELEVVRLLDARGIEVGSALFGQTTPDLNKNLANRGLNQRYRGYVLSSASGSGVVVQGEDQHGPVCRMNAVLPTALFWVKPGELDQATLDSKAIVPPNGWTGADSTHSDLSVNGLRVYGSFMRNGDSDEGSISLRVHRGDRFLYRSGPIAGHQTLEIAGQPLVTLSVAPGWVLLDFAGPNLPDGEFLVKLTDAGTGWGEWSAIALRASATDLPALFRSEPATLTSDNATVGADHILPTTQWTGSDAFHTNLCDAGLRVLGSFGPHGDSDSGTLSLRLKRGDKLLYRSGPIAGNQVLEIAGHAPLTLPVATDWVTLDFSGTNLPDGAFVVRLTDRGTAWGEWSAIALRDNRPCRQGKSVSQ